MPEFNDEMALGEARDVLRSLARAGARCPLCTRNVKVYRFPFNAAMARGLIKMYDAGGRDVRMWVKVPELKLPGGHMLKARFWGLIEKPAELRREDGSQRVGWWRVTPTGEAWVLGRSLISSHALIYSDRCLGLEGEQVGIETVLGVQFNYRELMSSSSA